MIGALYAAGAGKALDFELGKRKRDEQNMTGVPFSQQLNVAKSMAAGTAYGDGRRAAAFVTRLHPAKYLKCEPLLKELFFPTLTIGKRFGFCSTSGIDARGAGMADVNGSQDPVTWSKSAGVYRGIAMFTIRSQTQPHGDESKLNAKPQSIGTSMITGTSRDIRSLYRRFNSRPPMINAAVNGYYVAGNTAPLVSADQFPTPAGDTPHPAGTLYVPEVGSINELETKAVQSSNFQHAVGASTASEGTTSIGVLEGATAGTNWNGQHSVVGPDDKYYANLKNTTIRISDGYLEMDISNGKATSTFIEVVIHAHRKHASNVITEDLMRAIHSAVQYQQTDRNVTPFYGNSTDEQRPGGWQAFWDPTYPLLGVKSQHRKPVDDIAREVHRSAHMLGPGQSKLIKIFLGNLYYDLGSKCTDSSETGDSTQPFSFDNPELGVGALNVTIGHSGVMQLSAPSDPDGGILSSQFNILPDTYDETTNAHTHIGGGFWVGKSFCPSEIVVSGNYVEKFYPAYVVDKERRNWSDSPLTPPHNTIGQAYPTALPVTNTVGTIPVNNGGIPSQVTSQNNNL